ALASGARGRPFESARARSNSLQIDADPDAPRPAASPVPSTRRGAGAAAPERAGPLRATAAACARGSGTNLLQQPRVRAAVAPARPLLRDLTQRGAQRRVIRGPRRLRALRGAILGCDATRPPLRDVE